MAEKNAILRHVSYSTVQQTVIKIAVFLHRNWGPATPQLGPHYHATGALSQCNGGPVTTQRGAYCDAAEASLRWNINAVAAHRNKRPLDCGTIFHNCQVNFTPNVQKTLTKICDVIKNKLTLQPTITQPFFIIYKLY